MRVLVSLLPLTPANPSGTAFARFLLPELARRLGGRDAVTIQCDRSARELLAGTDAAFDVVAVPDRRPARLLAQRVALPRAVARVRPDVVYVPDGQLLGAPLRTPSVLAMHHALNFERPEETGLARRLYWKLYYDGAMRRAAARCVSLVAPGAPALIAPTNAFARELEGHLPAARGRIAVAFHGVDPVFRGAADSAGAPVAAGRTAGRHVLCVSNRFAYKNLAGAVRIAHRAFADHDVALHVAGLDGGEVEAVLDRHGVAGQARRRVLALGRLPPARLAEAYRLADALLFPSLVESFGLPLVEAMASGCPVVASHLPAIQEVTAGAAALADPADEAAFAEALARTVLEPERAAALRAAGLQRAEGFSWTETARQTIDILQRAAGLEAAA